MGLDMYLHKSTYVKNWDFMTAERRHKITVRLGGKIRKDIKPERISTIVEQVAYWRKANQIHNWFVKTVQNGVDDCGEYDVSKEQLQTLVELCKTVLNSVELVDDKVTNGFRSVKGGPFEPILEDGQQIAQKKIAADLLPTAAGFFFGSTDYDQYYIEDLKSTVEQLEPLLTEPGDGDFRYSSSW